MTMHRPGEKKSGQQLSRRQFLSLTWWGVAGLIGLEAGVGLVWSLWPKSKKPKPGEFGAVFPAGNVNDYKVGDDPKLVERGKFFLSRIPDGYLALYRRCTHLGCPVPWAPDEPSLDSLGAQGQFHCRCHGSRFDRYGVNKDGPAPRPMDLLAVDIGADGAIRVDTSKITTRTGYDPSQATKG
ncbi:MAG: ubiquinol-cytochrome c reductase iron-sulfur subunit [Chloroflexi bacterium]|nr:ubiquinol-cytochrome c reductase iron-sulfur subunit [Chloroflexota bacterium]